MGKKYTTDKIFMENGSLDINSSHDGSDLTVLSISSSGQTTFNNGQITLGGTGRIQGVDTVDVDTDAANKAYVDAAVSGGVGGNFLPLSAGSGFPLTGGLYIPHYIYHDGDAGTFIGFPSNDRLIIGTNGATRVDITNSGFCLGDSGTSISVSTILDEDDMASDSATALATQQSIKAYVDAQTDTGAYLPLSGGTLTGPLAGTSATFSGAASASNLSGTNTGDQNLSGYALISAIPTNNNQLINGAGYLLDTTDTFTGALTINGDIRGAGQQLVLNAGESYNYATGQTDEYVYANAEQGLQINSSPDNWVSGWAGRRTSTINDLSGSSSFYNNITVGGNQYFNGEFIEGDGKEMFRYSDSWLRINEDNDFGSGIYCGTGILRTDGAFQVGAAGTKFLVTAAGAVTAESTITAEGGFLVPYAAATKKPMVNLAGATNYGLWHTEGSDDIFSFDFGGTSKQQFFQSGNAAFAGDLTVSGGDITLGGTGRIQGVDTVSASTDAANKAYVDTKLSLAGGTMANTNLVTNMNADLLDGKDHTAFGATLATYGTTAGASGRIRCTAPFNTNTGHMFQVTVSIYSSYTIHTYVVGGYMYSSPNNWYSPRAVYSGTGSPDIVVGRDNTGKAYISIANGNYLGVRVHNMTRGYQTSVADTYDPWTVTIDAATPNSVSVDVSTTWNSGNDGSGSGLDADLLDGQQGSHYLDYANFTGTVPTWNQSTTGNAATATALGHSYNRTDTASYPVVWMTASSTSQAYSCAAVTITSSAGRINATTFNGALTGNATTATTATTSNLIKVNDYAGATNMRILGSHQTGGSDTVYSNASMYLNCDTGIINATGFVGTLTGNVAGNANGVSETGYGSDNFTFWQTSGTFAGYSGWANYLIGNHGNGSTYYNTVHIMPFWGAPKYSRLEGGTQTAVYDYWTSENHTPSNYLPLVGGAMTGNIQMNSQIFATAGNYGRGVFGLYNASKYQHVWSMGTAYKLADNGASTGTGGNLYGLAWSYNPDHGGAGNNAQSKPGLQHQLLLMMNGTTKFAAGNGMWTSGNATIEGTMVANQISLKSGASEYLAVSSYSGSSYIYGSSSGSTIYFGQPATWAQNIQVSGDARISGRLAVNTSTVVGSAINVEVPITNSGVGSDFRISTGSGYGMRNLSVEIPGYGSGIKIYSPTSSGVDNGAMTFYQQTTTVGGITINTSSTSFNTTSDYRLKENREDISDAIERVKELKPIKFNWIKEPGESKVDGFYAHELAEVVPEAVTGEKDALDWEGNPEYQAIDQAKIVPLLTAALQQAIDKIEALELRINKLEKQ